VILLTDGVETAVGDDAATTARELVDAGHRVGVCGVGAAIDTARLDAIGKAGRGDSAYPVRARELGASVRHLLETTRAVPLTDVGVEIEGAGDLYPERIGMLRPGDPIIVAGRYALGGEVSIRVSAKVAGQRVVRSLRLKLQENGGDAAVARMWASRRVGYLLDRARAAGKLERYHDEIEQLGRRFGIVTPCTSLLVLEEADQKRFLKGMRRRPLLRAEGGVLAVPQRGPVTSEIFSEADLLLRIRRLQRCRSGAADPFGDLLGANRGKVRRVEDRVFYRAEDGSWVESAWAGRDVSGAEQVRFLSPRWRELAVSATTARILALGRRVVFALNDKALVRVVDP
jgi:hypothetical protein